MICFGKDTGMCRAYGLGQPVRRRATDASFIRTSGRYSVEFDRLPVAIGRTLDALYTAAGAGDPIIDSRPIEVAPTAIRIQRHILIFAPQRRTAILCAE